MARPKGRAPRKSFTTKAQETASLYESLVGRQIPDHELNVLGYANVNRRFDLDEPSNGPSIVFRNVKAYGGFIKGYSHTDISDQDCDAAYNTSPPAVTTQLFPITPIAKYFEQDVWPVLENLFASGTGQRYDISIHEFIRYQACILELYQDLLIPVVLNKMTFHTDWEKVVPFSGNVPTFLYQLCTNLEATDVGIAETWLPLMKRMEGLVCFPRMLHECKRMLTPMLSVDFHGRVLYPINDYVATANATNIAATVEGRLNFIQTELDKAANLCATFFPFPVRDMEPWNIPNLPVSDPDREAGWFNSNCWEYGTMDTFGDTGDPTNQDTVVFDESADLDAWWYTFHCQPIWAEIKMASLWYVIDHATDDTWWLMTPHHYGKITILDDAFDAVNFDGSAIATGSLGYRYSQYANCRFNESQISHGVQKPGLNGAHISYNPVERIMRQETSYCFNLDVLKAVTASMAGASLRELKWHIKEMVSKGVAGPV